MPEEMVLNFVLVSALGCSLVAGIFFAFSNFVMAALGGIAPAQGIAAMNEINITVINRWFVGLFIGTGILDFGLLLSVIFLKPEFNNIFVAVGALTYLLGTLGVTFVFNIPLNNSLAEVAPASTKGEIFWQVYLKRWTFWNSFRAGAALLAATCLLVATY